MTGSARPSPAAFQHAPVDVFASGVGGAHTYRLPSLLATRRGALLLFAHGRLASARDVGASAVFLSTSLDGGKTWTAARRVLSDPSNRTMIAQQAVHDQRSGRVFLLANQVPCSRCHGLRAALRRRPCGPCTTFVMSSDDEGRSWSEAVALPGEGTLGSGVTSGVTLRRGRHAGRLLAARRADCCDCAGSPQSYALLSDDRGRTWRAGGRLPVGWTESAIAELPNGSVLLTARALRGRAARLGGRRLFARSDDAGETWARTWGFSGGGGEGGLRDPDCAASMISAEQGPRLWFANPAHATRRCNLSLHASDDGGAHWQLAHVIHPGRSAYSDMALTPSGDLAIAFERGNHRFISVTVLPRPALASKEQDSYLRGNAANTATKCKR